MKTITVNNIKIEYCTKETLSEEKHNPDYPNYMQLLDFADAFADLLKIPCPGIAIINKIYTPNGNPESGHIFTPLDDPKLNSSIICFSREFSYDEKIVYGTFLHEIRHAWQAKYDPELYKTNKRDYDCLLSPAEIDSDGFAIYFMTYKYGINIESAAKIICPGLSKMNPVAFSLRTQKAKALKAEFDTYFQEIGWL